MRLGRQTASSMLQSSQMVIRVLSHTILLTLCISKKGDAVLSNPFSPWLSSCVSLVTLEDTLVIPDLCDSTLLSILPFFCRPSDKIVSKKKEKKRGEEKVDSTIRRTVTFACTNHKRDDTTLPLTSPVHSGSSVNMFSVKQVHSNKDASERRDKDLCMLQAIFILISFFFRWFAAFLLDFRSLQE